uniref:Sec1-like protein n=1 Tax=Tetradesmus obliquus TaxID=3088 RepID=A0A383V6D1_TETOB
MAKTKPVLPLLEAGPVPLAQIRTNAKKQLVDIVDSKRGKKALILDPAISGSLTQLDAGLSELFTEHGIVKLLYLERTRLDDSSYNSVEPRLADVKPVIYIARATLDNAQLIAWQVKAACSSSSSSSHGGSRSGAAAAAAAAQHEFSVFWVPRRSIAVEKVLEDEGVYGSITQGEFGLDLVPLEDDVLSLELDRAFRECTLEGDPSSLFYAASALLKLQQMYGLIPRLQGKGPAAKAVMDMAVRMRREAPLPAAAAAACRIHRVVLLDREVDPITPMVTQITFEGLIDEVTGIKHGSAPYTPSRREAGAAESARGRPGSTLLNSSDPFYREFRDLPYYITSQSSALDRLSDLAVPVAEVVKEQEFHDRLKAEADLLEGFDTEESVAYIQGQMWRGADPVQVLRLLCLLSCTAGGLPKKHGDSLRSEFLAAYGHQHLLTLNNLERAGLLKPHQSGARAQFSTLRKALRLVMPEQDPQLSASPSDVSHIYKGYAPLSVRLVEAALGGGWGPVSEVLSLLPGGQFDVLQVLEPSGQVADKAFKPSSSSAADAAVAAAAGEPEIVLLVMLGGITFSEISALRFLSSRPENNVRFLVLTTKIINGRTLLESFIDPPAKSTRKA